MPPSPFVAALSSNERVKFVTSFAFTKVKLVDMAFLSVPPKPMPSCLTLGSATMGLTIP